MRLAFKVAYWGERFHGSQRQPDVRTVEGDLLRALRDVGAIEDPAEARFESASRTDAGVSALGNVVALDTTWDPRRVVAAVNPRLQDIWLWGYARPGAGFRPRRARERWYRYHFPHVLDCARVEEAGRIFQGTHDFRAFAKGEGGRCEIRAVTCAQEGAWTVLDVRGDRFLWGMIRRMAGAVEGCARGLWSSEDLALGLETGTGAWPPSPPDGLILMDVSYPFPFRPLAEPLRDSLRERESRRRLEAVLLRSLQRAAQTSDPSAAAPWYEVLKASLHPGAND